MSIDGAVTVDMAYEAPGSPPPLLTPAELLHLAHHGHLRLPLSEQLSTLYESLTEATRLYFRHPTPTKQALYPSPRPELGFFNVPAEKQYLSLRHASPTQGGDASIETLAREVWAQSAALLHRVFADIAAGLDVDVKAWDPVLDGCLALPSADDDVDNLPTVLRVFQYEPHKGTADPHIDTGLLTLCFGTGRGLQVFSRGRITENGTQAGTWSDADGPILLVGETLRSLTSERLKCGLHRVVANPGGRMSVIFALRPSLRHEIDLSALRGNGMIHLRDLHSNILDRRYNINVNKDTREEQKTEIRARLQAV